MTFVRFSVVMCGYHLANLINEGDPPRRTG